MANLKDLRTRIVSIGNTMKITSAMKMVSAAKLKKAQDAIQSMRPYSEKLTEILQNVSSSLSPDENPFAQKREVKKVLLVLLTSNRGLCGPFNSSIIKAAYARMAELKGVDVEIMTIGKKANDLLKKTGKVVENESAIWNSLKFENNPSDKITRLEIYANAHLFSLQQHGQIDLLKRIAIGCGVGLNENDM